jgi:glycosyltransferase involved in cell wall biosynthesis
MQKSIKVLHVIYALSGGGAERQLEFLVNNAPQDSEHGVLCVDLANYGAQVFVHKRQGKFDWGLYQTCFKTIKSFKPDVIHLWLPPVITIPAMLTAKCLRKPIIFSYRNLMHFDRLLAVIEYLLACVFSQKVISNNLIDQSKKPYQWLYKLKNGLTIHNGLDFRLIEQKEDHAIKINEPIKLIFVGRLVEQKNILNLIRALSKITINQQWTLDIFGEGNLKSAALNLVQELELHGQVFFHGFEKAIYKKLLSSDLLLMPSILEGMPNVLVEALAIKIPVVTSNIPSVIDVVGESGAVILIDPNSIESITKGIEKYMNNQKYFIENLQIGLEIAKNYNATLMSAKYHEVYQQLSNAL